VLHRIKAAIVEQLGVNRIARATDVHAADTEALRAVVEGLRAEVDELRLERWRRGEYGLWERISANTDLVSVLIAPTDTRVSVVLPTRNRATMLRRAIASVLAQQHPTWQLVVVDDGSTDATPQVLSEIADPRIISVRGEGRGSAAARNLGLAHTTGDWVAFLDDDNVMAPGWLHAIALFAAREPEHSVFYGAQLRQNELSLQPGFAEARAFFDEQITPQSLATYGRLDMGMLAVRRDTDELHFDESLPRFVDWELTVRLAAKYTLRPVPVWASVYSTEASHRVTTPNSEDAIAQFVARLADPDDPVGTPAGAR